MDKRKNIEMKILITDAIVELLGDQGMKNVTVKQICQKAGISLGTFYSYFSSKYDVVTHMYEVMDDFLIERKTLMQSHEKGEEDILSFASFFGEFVADWGYYANLLILASSLEELTESKVRLRRIEKLILELVEDAKDKGFDCPLESLDYAQSILALIRGCLLEWAKAGADFPIQEKIEQRMSIYLQLNGKK